jgi:hypothetical protein
MLFGGQKRDHKEGEQLVGSRLMLVDEWMGCHVVVVVFFFFCGWTIENKQRHCMWKSLIIFSTFIFNSMDLKIMYFNDFLQLELSKGILIKFETL